MSGETLVSPGLPGRQKLVVLGATGSVGRNTLDVASRHPQRLEVWALTASTDDQGLAELCKQFRPAHAVLVDADAAARLRLALKAAGLVTEVHAGTESLNAVAAAAEAGPVMAAIAGSPGLQPTLAAIRAGKRVLVANKEPLVMAGALMLREAALSGATVLPIDSEHNAIFQCLPHTVRCGQALPRGVQRVILTASGGPFREWTRAQMQSVTPEQAVKHPNWSMGRKISVDSATLMNKGLEMIEAAVLYGLPESRIDVVIHPESIIHSMVEYVDGSTLAQLGQPDMRTPIAHALAWPERWQSGVAGLDWRQLSQLRFCPVDVEQFPALRLARQVLREGGHAAIVLNAANEVAVERFLAGRLAFTAIAESVERVLELAAGCSEFPAGDELSAILMVDAWARRATNSVVEGIV